MKAAANTARTKVEPTPPVEAAPVDSFLLLLARAVRNFRLYPADSTFRDEAVAACHEAHSALRGFDRLSCRVSRRELLVDDRAIGSGTLVEHELARRLHRLQVADLTFESTVTSRDLSQFCATVLACDERQGGDLTLADRLTRDGVEAIVPRIAARPEVLDVDTARVLQFDPSRVPKPDEKPSVETLPASGAEAVGYLYPKGKGWVRLDPKASSEALTLTDLALAVEDPRDLSLMLLRLSNDGGTEDIKRDAALRLKFDDLTMIFASMPPELGRAMFSKLARSVLALGVDARQSLLKDTVLPGLIEGRSAGQILNDFPDLELADAIGLLLDLETSDPGVINAALTRLELPPDRRQAMTPLLQRRLKQRDAAGTPVDPGTADVIDRFAEKWIKIDAQAGKNFLELSAFDLSFGPAARAEASGISDTVEGADALDAKVTCVLGLLRLNPTPQVVDTLLERLAGAIAAFERADRWPDLISAVSRARDLGETLTESRSDIAQAITTTLSGHCTRTRTLRIVQLEERGGDDSVTARRLVEAFGAAIALSFGGLLQDGVDESKMAALTHLMRDHARLLAPGIVPALKTCPPRTACVLLSLLASAGPGFEKAVAHRLADEDETVFHAALGALSRIGTSPAAAAVATQIRTGSRARCQLAEATLWRFAPAMIQVQLFELLRDREFVFGRRDIVLKVLQRAHATDVEVPRETLRTLSRLMFRLWQPSLVRIGLKARRMVGR
ncbi:MAG: hypothetical protein ABL986_02985 [Vicinamibacterales bacterium]